MVPVLAGPLGRWVSSVLLAILAGASGGWYVRGRVAAGTEAHLRARIEHFQLTADRATDLAREWQRNNEVLQHNVATLEVALARQNEAMERLHVARARAEERRRAAEDRLREYLSRPSDPVVITPGSCEEMVEQARRLGGGR